MALKYTLHVNSVKGQDWLVEIDSPTYSGDPIELIGDENPILIEWNGGVDDDPFKSHIIPQTATFRVYDDNLDVEELQLVDDASFKCRVYLNSQLKHQGYIISDGIQDNDSGVASLVTIKSIDGLELGGNIEFSWGNNYGTISVDGQESAQRCPMNIIRLCLYRFDMIDNVLPIRWATSLKSNQYPNDDMLAGRNKLNYDGKLVRYGNKSARWYLEEICRTAQCWMYQRDGYWYIENRGDTIRNGGFMNGWEITTSTSPQVATPISIDLNTRELSGEFINEDAYWMVKKPLGGVNVTYNATRDENVLPNGGMDRWSIDGSFVYDWGWRTSTPSGSIIEQHESIDGRDGYAVKLTVPSESDITGSFAPLHQLRVDTKFLFKSFTFGFNIMPTQYGFPYDPETSVINWDSDPLQVTVSFKWMNNTWFLNEFGYWVRLPITPLLQMVETNGDIYNSSFTFSGRPTRGQLIKLEYRWVAFGNNLKAGGVYQVSAAEEENLPLLMNNLRAWVVSSLNIPSAGYWTVGGSGNTITVSTTVSGDFFSQTFGVNTSPNGVNSLGAIPLSFDGLKINDIASFQFQGKGGNPEILLPEISDIQETIGTPPFNSPPNGLLDIRFRVNQGQQYVLDNVYINMQDNDDRFEVRVPSSKSPIEDATVEISSGFTSFFWSSYMDDFGKTNLSMWWGYNSSGENTKTLTQLYGEFMMDWRNKPRKIFNGSIDEVVQCGDFVTIKGVKYIILNASMQGDGVTRILAFEASLNPTTYSVTHTSTNNEGG